MPKRLQGIEQNNFNEDEVDDGIEGTPRAATNTEIRQTSSNVATKANNEDD